MSLCCAVADVSAVAYNLALYDKDYGGWVLVAGTSASSPVIAGIYGLAGNAAKPGYDAPTGLGTPNGIGAF